MYIDQLQNYIITTTILSKNSCWTHPNNNSKDTKSATTFYANNNNKQTNNQHCKHWYTVPAIVP